MKFLNEPWFWSGAFGLFGTLGGILLTLIGTGRYQLKALRIKLYEKESLVAYKELYKFIAALGNVLFPPNDPSNDFMEIMKDNFAEEVGENILFFSKPIRILIRELESQYDCLVNPDLSSSISFDEFYEERMMIVLNSILKLIEANTDKILK